MNRIVERFARLKRERQKGFIVYLGAGDPSLEATRQLALAFDRRLAPEQIEFHLQRLIEIRSRLPDYLFTKV